MNTKQTPTTSPFSTKDTDAKAVQALMQSAVDHVGTDGVIDWKTFPDAVRPFDINDGKCSIGYSRAWLIVRRAWLEMFEPKSLVTLPEVDPSKVAAGDNLKDATNRAWSKVISPMRDTDQLSWGEISVRVGKPESKIRACYKATGAKKDLGLRIGKGGRFAYGEPEFYLAHRKDQGAQIPSTLTHKPKVEELLNARDAQGKLVKFTVTKTPAKKAAPKPKAIAEKSQAS